MRGPAPTVGLLALLQVVVAQQECLSLTSKFPECAFSCITSAGSAVGCTVATDVACRCTPASSQAIVQTALNCVLAGCPFSEVSNVIAAGSSVCACVATATSEPPPATTTDVSTSTTVPEETSTSVPEEPSASTSQQTTEEPPPTTATSEQPVTTTPPPQVTCTPDSPCQESADAVPECAQSCISSAAADAAGCREGDYGCSCASQAVILPAAQGCVIDGCGIPGALQVLSSVSALCDCVTASPTTPCDGGEPTATTSSGGDDDDDEETTTTSPPDSETTEPPPETTCEGATTSDCGPVASTAIPQCAQACFSSAAPNVGCGADDFGCQCQEEAQASLSQLLIPCVATACDSGDLPGVITGAASVCACATAPPSGGNCPTETNSPPPPPTGTTTTTRSDGGDGEPTTTCAQATTPDCGPVATSVIPDCAQPCFAEGAPGVGCDADDYGCQCEPDALASLSAILVPCVATACPPASIPLVIAGASSVCQCAQAGPTGACPGDGGSGEPTTKPPPPTTTNSDGAPEPTATCAPGEPADCGAVATSALPSCAQACFSSAAPGVGCDATDFGCQCEPAARESLSQLLIPCVATACDSGDLPAVITGAESVCACATAAPSGGDCPAPTGGNGGGGGSGGGGGNDGGNGGGSGGNGDGSNGGGSGGNGDGSSGGGDGGSGGGDGSNGGGDGSGGNGGGDEDGDGPLVIPPSSGGRLEVGFVAGVFGAVWLLAVAL